MMKDRGGGWYIRYEGNTVYLRELAKDHGIDTTTIKRRLDRGLPLADALQKSRQVSKVDRDKVDK